MRELAKKYIYPLIGDTPLKSVTASHVAKILNEVFKHSPVLERKVKTLIKHTFREAIRMEKVKDLKSPFGPELEVLTSGRKPSVPKANMGALHHSQIPSFIKA
ncbi:MAG: hypothetical protein LUC43_05220 [Burkholderiales bacterium]|nr:hypothetical protein [Burkholderiales bacterium]